MKLRMAACKNDGTIAPNNGKSQSNGNKFFLNQWKLRDGIKVIAYITQSQLLDDQKVDDDNENLKGKNSK